MIFEAGCCNLDGPSQTCCANTCHSKVQKMPKQDFRNIKIMLPLCANQMKPSPRDQSNKTVRRMPRFLLNSWPSQRRLELEQGMTRSLLNDSDLSNNLEFCALSILGWGCGCSKDQRLLGGCCCTFTTSRFTNSKLLSTMEGGDSGPVIATAVRHSHLLI